MITLKTRIQTLLYLIGICLTNSSLFAQQLTIDILNPAPQTCVNNGIPPEENPINADNHVSNPVPIDLSISDPYGTSLVLSVSAWENKPSYLQPPPKTCSYVDGGNRQAQVNACQSKGYCVLTGICVCGSSADCGGALCKSDGTCGCTSNNDCNGGTCLPDGTCGCSANSCSPGQQCLPSGACSCTNNTDCGGSLICEAGVCSSQKNIQTAYYSIDPAQQGETLPRSVNYTAYTPNGVQDSASITVEVTVDQAQNGSVIGSATAVKDKVAFKLDRSYPLLTISEQITNTLNGCRQPLNLNLPLGAGFSLTDNLDPNPIVEILPNVVNGCQTKQRVKVSDSCGNAQIVNISTFRVPQPNEISFNLQGIRCFGQACDPNQLPVVNFQNGDVIGRGLVQTNVTAPNACFSYTTANVKEISTNGQVLSTNLFFEQQIFQALPAELTSQINVVGINGAILSNRGPFTIVDGSQLTVSVTPNQNQTITFRDADFPDPSEVSALDALIALNQKLTVVKAVLENGALKLKSIEKGRSVIITVSGTAADALGFAVGNRTASGKGDGIYRVESDLYVCNTQKFASTAIEFTVSKGIKVDAGGPYLVNQGQTLMLNAQNSFVPTEFGGIAKLEWDFENDGIFDRLIEFPNPLPNPLSAEQIAQLYQVEFDTKKNAIYQVKLQLTTGFGDVAQTTTTVEVKDVSPVCAFQDQSIEIFEGQSIRLEAFNSAPGDINDPIVSYTWGFGDQSAPTVTAEPFVDHVYQVAGDYIATLRIDDIDSFCAPSATLRIKVKGVVPIVENLAIRLPLGEITEGDMVTLSAGDTRAGSLNDPILSYVWDFGDGLRENGAALIEPQHRYENQGNFSACLTVRDSNDTVGPVCLPVVVKDLSPTAIFTAPGSGEEGQEITFDATGSVAGGQYDPLTKLTWDFGDGSMPVQVPPSQMVITHTFVRSGLLTVKLSVSDEDNTVIFEKPINVLDVYPTANFSITLPARPMPPEGCEALDLACEGESVTLNASASRPGAPSDPIVKYTWQFGEGGADVVTNNPITMYAWKDGGIAIVQNDGSIQILPSTYQITLTVEDSDGSLATTIQTIDVANKAPIVEITGPSSEEVLKPTTFSMNIADVMGDIPPAQIEWDMGDGTIYTYPSAEHPNPLTSITHTFRSETRYLITVTINDGEGGEAEDSLNFTANPRSPTIADPSVVQVLRADGQVIPNPRLPIGSYEGDAQSPNVFYIREGQRFVLEVPVSSASLSNGTLDAANAVWSILPDGAVAEYIPVLPARGQANEGSREKVAKVTWVPSFYQQGEYRLRLTAQGEVSNASASSEFIIKVIDGGSFMLATTAGNPRRAKVVIYKYEKENASLVFNPDSEVEIGLGAYDIEIDQAKQRLFATSPGSGHVAVIAMNPTRVIRKIKTGNGAYDLAWGHQYLWVTNVDDHSISAINPVTLKVVANFKSQVLRKPASIIAFQGQNQEARLLVGSLKGDLFVIDASALLRGDGNAILNQISVGGSISKLTIDDNQIISIANPKMRKVYQISTFDLLNNQPPVLDPILGIYFAPRDIIAQNDSLWIATGSALYEARDGALQRSMDLPALSLGHLDDQTLEGPGIAVFDFNQRLGNYLTTTDDPSEVIGLDSTRIHQMVNFVYLLP